MKASNNSLTIITVVYNDKKGLIKTINSIVINIPSYVEYIVIDGGSTDGTIDVIRQNEKHIDYWISEPDRGIYDAMNKGLKAAQGEWVIFMNAGDTFYDNKVLKRFEPYLQKDYSVVYGKIMLDFGNRKEVGENIIKKKQPDIVDFVIKTIPHQAAFIRKKLFDKYGFYDENYKLAADQIFFMQTIGVHKEKCKFVNTVVANFMMGGANEKYRDQCRQEKKEAITNEVGACYVFLRELAEYRNSFLLRILLATRLWAREKGLLSRIKKIIYYNR